MDNVPITRVAIVAEAREWIGTPWQHQACLKGVACDCIGLVVGVAEGVGIAEAAAWKADPRYRGYGPTPLVPQLLAACTDYLDPVALTATRMGDVLLFAFAGEPMHFGLLSREWPRYVIHGYQNHGKVVEHSIDLKWSRRIVGAYRYRGVG